MKILILSSSSRHFPLDIQDSLKEAGLESHRLRSLNEFIASPLRKEPFLAILEVGTTEDIDRALVAYEWAETVQPLAAARYLLLVGSKHISLQEKSSRFRGVEIAQLPLPTKNLLFKVELQLKVLSKESNSKIQRKVDGFSAEIREVERGRVMVIRGMGPKEGGWKNSGNTPQGRTRWRWIDDPPKKGRPEEAFSWSAESKTAPEFNSETGAWEVKDPEADLQCHRGGEEIYSAKKSVKEGEGPAAEETDAPGAHSARSPGKSAESRADESKPGEFAESAGATKENSPRHGNADPASTPDQRVPLPEKPAEKSPVAAIPGEKRSGVNPFKPQAAPEPATKSHNSPSPSAPAKEKAAPPAAAAPKADTASQKQSAGAEMELPKLGETKPRGPGSALPELGGKKQASPRDEAEQAAAFPRKNRAASSDTPAPKEHPQRPDPTAPIQSAPAKPQPSAQATAFDTPASSERKTSPLPSATAPVAQDQAAPPSAAKSPPLSHSGPERPEFTNQARGAKQSIANISGEHRPPRPGSAANAPTPAGEPEKPATPQAAPPLSSSLKTEVIESTQPHPAEKGMDSETEFPEKTREITGKVVIPTGPAHSDHQNLLRSSGGRDSSDRNVISSPRGEAAQSQHLKSRHFLILSLEELQDQNSTWFPVEGYRIYLSARHRYYGLRDLNDIFPLWIYEGELAPEFLDQQKAWKFYDRLPQSYPGIHGLPAPVENHLRAMLGEKRPDPAVTLEINGKEEKEAKAAGTASAATRTSAFTIEPEKNAATISHRTGLISMIRRLLGLKD